MYTPKYYISNRILHYTVQFELAIKNIVSIPFPTKQKAEILMRSRTENLYYIAKLAGIDTTMKDVEKVFTGRVTNVFERPRVVLINYRNVIEFIKQMKKDKYLVLSAGTILHLNKLITNNWVESWNCGRFRTQDESPIASYDRWIDHRNKSRSLLSVQQDLSAIVDWVQETRFMVHPLIKMGVIFYEIFHMAPFYAGNQLTLFAILEMLYSEFDIWNKGLIPVSRHFHMYEDEYLEMLSTCGESGDLTAWLEKFIKGVSLDVNSLCDQLYQIEREKVEKKKRMLLGLNSRQLQVLSYLKRKFRITRREYNDLMGISFMTSYRDLTELVERQLIFQYGHGRSTHYTLNPKEEIVDGVDFEAEGFKKVGNISDNDNF